MPDKNDKDLKKLMQLLDTATEPFNENVVAMDCNDGCEEIAENAERVANGENLKDVYPEYANHLDIINCSKEEFEVLVSVIRAELDAAQEDSSDNA
ncbi:MAG: hypothetical protein AAF787_22740 [Chloroflexota bacterium]